MTNQEAIHQLEQVAHICTTTALAEACLMGARALEKESHDCNNCKHYSYPGAIAYPCYGCSHNTSDKWEAKEGDADE